MPLLCIAMLVVTVALATWALVEGVNGIHHKVDDFWAIEQSIRDQARAPAAVSQPHAHFRLAHDKFLARPWGLNMRPVYVQISSLRQDVLTFFGGIASIQQAASALSTALTGAIGHCRLSRPHLAAVSGCLQRNHREACRGLTVFPTAVCCLQASTSTT